MFIVLLKFAEHKSQVPHHMAGHNAWLRRGFDDGVFLLAGSIQPKKGGGIVAANTTPEDLQIRLNEDPFVTEGVVTAEIIEISPSKTDQRLAFLVA